MSKKTLYRIRFIDEESQYELFAHEVHDSAILGFLQISDIVFHDNSSVVIDTIQERLKESFAGVKSSYIPIDSVIRIDEVDKPSSVNSAPAMSSTSTVRIFPSKEKER